MSQARVMLEVLRHGPIARSEIARRLDLSPASLTRMVATLTDEGLLAETGTSSAQSMGRPTRPLEVVPEARHFIGVKVTAEAAHAVLTDLHAQVHARAERALPDTDPAAVAAEVDALIRELDPTPERVSAIGVSVGGSIVDHAHVTYAPFLDWSDVPFGDLLAERTGLRVVVDNDVVAMARAEQWFGVGRDSDRFVVITIGAGVGYGLVVHDRVVDGVVAGVGTLGHLMLDPNGPWCAEGHRGCATVSLTSPSIAGSVSLSLQRSVTYDEALDLAAAGNTGARAVIDDAGRALGRLVAAVSNIAMTDRVVLAGEGSRLADVARAAIEEEVAAGRHPRTPVLRLEVRDTGNEQWARGAAVSAIQSWAARPVGHP